VPSTPDNLRIVRVVGPDVTVAWTPPDSDGGAEITGYVIAYCTQYDSVARHVTATGTTTAMLMDICQFRRCYVFAVAARNAVGTGDFSQCTDFTVPQIIGNSFFSIFSPPNDSREVLCLSL